MSESPRTYTPEQKLKIVLESMQQNTTIEAVRIKYGIAKSVMHRWREQFKERAAQAVFNPPVPGKQPPKPPPGESPAELKRVIGDLYTQNEILKKVSGLPDIR